MKKDGKDFLCCNAPSTALGFNTKPKTESLRGLSTEKKHENIRIKTRSSEHLQMEKRFKHFS